MEGEVSMAEHTLNENPSANVDGVGPRSKTKCCSWLDFHGVAEAKGYAYVGSELCFPPLNSAAPFLN